MKTTMGNHTSSTTHISSPMQGLTQNPSTNPMQVPQDFLTQDLEAKPLLVEEADPLVVEVEEVGR